jgi:putative adhesin
MSIGGWRLAAAGLGTAAMMAGTAGPVQGAVRVEKHLALAPGGRLTVSTEVGSVVVRGDAASGAAVVVTSDRDDLDREYEMSFAATPGQAQVIIKRRHRDWSWFEGWQHWRGRVEIAVDVPRATAVSVRASGGRVEASGLEGDTELSSSGGSVVAHELAGKLVAHSSGGAVEVRDLRGDLHLSSSGGRVRATSVQGAVDAQSSGGSVQLEQVAGSVRADSSGGSVTVRGAGGRVEASSSGGPVAVSFAAGNAHGGNIGSSGGSVEVRVDPAVGLDVDAATSGGSVSCDLPVTVQGKISRHSLRGVLHGGGERLHVRSSGGGIRIAPL